MSPNTYRRTLLAAAACAAFAWSGCSRDGRETATPGPLSRESVTLTQSASHFGVHLGTLDYDGAVGYINQLGNQVYVRNEIYRDAVGWRKVGAGWTYAECDYCCDPSHSPCTCQAGTFYYCSPPSRSGLLSLPVISDFYLNHFNQVVDFYAGRYDDTPPTSSADLVAAYPYGHTSIYSNYAAYLALNMGDQVKYWEVGNENDISTFWDGTEQEYGNLVTLAAQAVRSQRSDCKVGISLSTPDVPTSWLNALTAVRSSIDFLDLHFGPWYITEGNLDRWKSAFPGREIIATECGVPDTTGFGDWCGGSKDLQAQDLVKYNTRLFHEGYNKLYWYLIDTDYGVGGLWLHNALIDENGVPKPAFYAYRTMIAKVDHFTAITRVSTGLYRYDFADHGPVYVAWCSTGPCSTLPLTGLVLVTDYLGNQTIRSAGSVVLGPTAVYVESATATSVPTS